MGDVGDVHVWLDGGMERGDAQIHPPPGAGKVPCEAEKGFGKEVPMQQDPVGTPCCNGGGGVHIRLVVGYTWAWVSLGFPTGLVHMELSSWPMMEG